MLEDLARKDYTVVAVHHPYDALIVEFPDGRAVIGLNKTLSRNEVETLATAVLRGGKSEKIHLCARKTCPL